jgi:aminopeptidase YwaD
VGVAFLDAIRTAASDYAEGSGSPDTGIVETRAGVQGTRNEFIADVTPYSFGSDHDDYDSSTIAVPSLYLRDWPDIYIHTDHDSLSQIDSTKLRRVALLGAASGYVYASLDKTQLPTLLLFLTAECQARLAEVFGSAQKLVDDPQLAPGEAWYEARNLVNQALRRENQVLRSLVEFTGGPADAETDGMNALTAQATAFNNWLDAQAKARGATGSAPSPSWLADAEVRRIPVRIGDFGPLAYQNDNVLLARLGKERYAKIKLLNSEATPLLSERDQSELYAYEIVNFVNSKRTVGEIRDAVSAEFGPLPVSLVADYLNACAEAKVIQWK